MIVERMHELVQLVYRFVSEQMYDPGGRGGEGLKDAGKINIRKCTLRTK